MPTPQAFISEPHNAGFVGCSWRVFAVVYLGVCDRIVGRFMEAARRRGRSDMWEHFDLITPDKVSKLFNSYFIRYLSICL